MYNDTKQHSVAFRQVYFVCRCDVIWFSPKALPSLHYFVSIVVQFTPTRPNDPERAKQLPKPKKGETARKIVGKIRNNN